jgi:hypothetical protein
MDTPTYLVVLYKDVEEFQAALHQAAAQYDLHSWQERSERDGGRIIAVYKRRAFNG